MTGTIRHKGDKMIFNISCNKQDQKHKQVGWPGQEEVVRRTERNEVMFKGMYYQI